ncbi:hypothetical protein V500_07852 [Pseudogymnoascus sp. VKM F-4518 (FW-2643)]|nr:hypothetical protein V500_07852 [Pseudogymnoascus sp. VKM F-4518 (FW-2643)]
MSDSDFPTTLNNAEKQINKAKELASQHLGIKAISAHLTTTQGCFSKTLEVSLQDGRSVIIQFRIEALDAEPFFHARNLLGDIVPIIEAIHDPELVKAGIWPFYMTRIPGKPWMEFEDVWNETQRATCSRSLGRIFSRCFVEGNTGEVVDSTIIPNLHKLRTLALERDDVKPFSAFIAKLIEEAPALKTLPLFFGHLDINEMNVLVGENAEITGVIDWELSPPPQPFGVACYCIQFLAGEIIDKVFRQRPEFEAIDREFWAGLLEDIPTKNRDSLEANWEAVQTAVMIGTIFKVMSIEGDEVFVSKIRLDALPMLMRYRIPALRGSSKAYSD